MSSIHCKNKRKMLNRKVGHSLEKPIVLLFVRKRQLYDWVFLYCFYDGSTTSSIVKLKNPREFDPPALRSTADKPCQVFCCGCDPQSFIITWYRSLKFSMLFQFECRCIAPQNNMQCANKNLLLDWMWLQNGSPRRKKKRLLSFILLEFARSMILAVSCSNSSMLGANCKVRVAFFYSFFTIVFVWG